MRATPQRSRSFVRVGRALAHPLLPRGRRRSSTSLFGAKIQRRFGKTPDPRGGGGRAWCSPASPPCTSSSAACSPSIPAQRFLLDEVFPMIDIGAVRVNMAFAMDPLGGVMATHGHRRGHRHPYLLHRLHARRAELLALLRLPQPLLLLHADAGPGRQLRPDVLRLGRGRALLLPPHRLLVQGPGQGHGPE